ncbi:MAG: Lpg1974 family pore-forming outer membrane protein [Parachlamydiales bacterium]|jgi:hypothetical protein
MEKFKKTISVFTVFMASLTGFLHADYPYRDNVTAYSDNNCCAQTCCEEAPSGHFFVNADLLYWKPYISGLELDFGTLSLSQALVDGTTIFTANELDVDPNFKWNAGYRIGAGYQFACSNWQIGAIWTHFQGKGSHRDGSVGEFANNGHCRTHLNQIDAVVAYNTCFCSSFNVKPFLGIRAAKIHQSISAQLFTEITLAAPTTVITESRFLDDTQNFRGLGPILGLNLDWDVGCGFGVYGSAATSILYGNYRVDFDDSGSTPAPISQEVISRIRKRLHAVDCVVDLALGVSWQTSFMESYQLAVKLGFEHHQYFNHNHLGANRGDLSFDGGILSVGVAL